MNHALSGLCNAILFATVPALLALRYFRPRLMPWWLLVCLSAMLSWVLVNLSLRFSEAHLADLVAQAGGVERAPADLVDDLMDDGGPRSFAFLFGWIGGLVLLAPGLVLYWMAHQFRTRREKGAALLPNAPLEQTRER